MALPAPGTRISHGGHTATVKYAGPVDGAQGIWLGVEWDAPDRGKHDGSKDGKRYFSCRYPTSGSFIRATPHIQYGVSFLEALAAKYVEALHGAHSQESVTLGSSQGAIRVEAVSLDKIRQKFARLDRLREASLENAAVVRADTPPGRIRSTCPNIRGLDLSQNLFVDWHTVAQIAQELPVLQRLALNRNRLQRPADGARLADAFAALLELQLNRTLMTWVDMQAITAYMPSLEVIEMGYNELVQLRTPDDPNPSPNTIVTFINLDSNTLTDWDHIFASLAAYTNLQRVVLSSNGLSSIPFPAAGSNSAAGTSPTIKYLSLSDNRIADWASIDALSCWFPNLEILAIAGNPLVTATGTSGENQTRPLIIARIPSLSTLDGATISARERADCELFYLSSIMQQGVVSDEARAKSHYHWNSLCQKYGRPEELQQQKNTNKLANQLLELHLHKYNGTDAKVDISIENPPDATIRVLPNMTLRVLRLKICKALKLDPRKTNIMFWLSITHGNLARLDNEQDTRDLDWLGIENNSHIIYRIT